MALPLSLPTSRVPDPMTAPPLNWGIMAPGWIAHMFASALRASTRQRLVAVGSRSPERGRAFADEFGIPTVHSSYADLVADPQVDVIYVASPHSEHADQALLAIEAGKHVLVEKAFARNAKEARRVVVAARRRQVAVMEAMWTRFLPHVDALHQVIDAGEIGEIINLSADHGQHFAFNPKSRLFDPALAGGALLDLGVYPVSFAHDFLGVPDAVHATGVLTETGVDGQASIVLSYGAHAQATLSTTLWARTPTTAAISGTEGFITVKGNFYTPTSFHVQRTDGRSWDFDQPGTKGLQFEAAEVARRIAAGDVESPRLTWANTLEVLRTLDSVRAQVGVVYPGE